MGLAEDKRLLVGGAEPDPWAATRALETRDAVLAMVVMPLDGEAWSVPGMQLILVR